MQRYWVVGGEYRDTKFRTPVPGAEEWIGPFETYQAAKQEWSRRAWKTVDDAHTRYRIEQADPDDVPICTD